MSSLSDFLGGSGGGGVTDSYTASTAVAGTKLVGNKAYPIASDGKIYDIDGGAFARTPFNSIAETYTEAELGDLARATTGGSTLGASAGLKDNPWQGDYFADYNTKFLPDGITEVDIYIDNTDNEEAYLTLSQNPTSFVNVGRLFVNGGDDLGGYKIMSLPEDSTHYYLAIYIVSYDSYASSPHKNHYLIVSIAKSDYTITVLETFLNSATNTLYSGNYTGGTDRELYRTVNFFSARNGTVFFSTRGNYPATNGLGNIYYNWGTHETGAGRTRAIDSSYNSSSNPVANLDTTGWYPSRVYPFQVFKISDADGTFLTYGNSTSSGTLKAQLLTLDASGGLTATDLTVSGSTTNLSANDRRYGKMLQTSTGNKFVHIGYNGVSGSFQATVVTLDTSANTLTFSSTTDTITGFGSEFYPSYAEDWFFLHGRDLILTNEGNIIDVDPTDFSVNSTARTGVHLEIFNNKSAFGSNSVSTVGDFDQFIIYPGPNDYTAVGIGPDRNENIDTVANTYVYYLKIKNIGDIVKTNSDIALVLADTDVGSTATIELASGNTATTSLDSTKFLTKEGMVYPYSTNINGIPVSPPTTPSIKSIQTIAYYKTQYITDDTIDISEVNPEKTYIAFFPNVSGLEDYTINATTLELAYSSTSTVRSVLVLVEGS